MRLCDIYPNVSGLFLCDSEVIKPLIKVLRGQLRCDGSHV